MEDLPHSFIRKKAEEKMDMEKEEDLMEINKELQINSAYQSNQSKQRNRVQTEHFYMSEQGKHVKFGGAQHFHPHVIFSEESPAIPKKTNQEGYQMIKKIELYSTIYNPPLLSMDIYHLIKEEFNLHFVVDEICKRIKQTQKIE